MRIRSSSQKNKCNRVVQRQGSVYVAVAGTAMLVSLLGITALHLSRLELQAAGAANEINYARKLAQSGVEFALGRIDLDSNWRNSFTHGVEVHASPSSHSEDFRFRLLDNLDNDLADDDDDLVEIQGIGRWGSAEFRYSVDFARPTATSEQVGPVILRVFDASGGNEATENVYADKWIGQYFVPNLPVEAVEWSVTEVDVLVKQNAMSDATIYVRLYEADGSGMPSTVLESGSLNKHSLPDSEFAWLTVPFATVTGRPAGTGLCLGLEGTHGVKKVSVRYESGGVAESNAHMLSGGSGSWTTAEASKSLFYRVRGVYTTSSGAGGRFKIVPGSWRRSGVN